MHRTLTLALLTACAPKGAPVTAADTSAPDFTAAIAARGVHVRASFDTDPSPYIGRFLRAGDDDPSETAAMELACSRYITPRVVSAGGVERDELLWASTEAAANLGIPPAYRLSASASQGVAVRVQYTETLKMQHEITDAAGFEACCAAAPEQCTDRFVGELIGGTGRVWYAVGSAAELGASGLATAAAGDVEVKDGRVWRAGLRFPTPVYFAFTVADNVHQDIVVASGDCDDPALGWDDQPPRSTRGQYFVGTSRLLPDEPGARDDALRDARAQAARWVAEAVSTSGGWAAMWASDGASASGEAVGGSEASSWAEGLVERAKDVAWCRERTARPTGGYDHRARVLVFLPAAPAAAGP